jgi:PAS domain S-box-containing protein
MGAQGEETVSTRDLGTALIAAADSARIGVSVTFLDRPRPVVSYINDAGVSILGHSREHILSVPAVELLAPSETPGAEARLRSRREGNPASSWYDTVAVTADGRRVPVHVGMAHVQIDGRAAAISYILDTTDEAAAQEALARSERRFRELVEASPDPLWVADGRKLTYVNPTVVRILGYPDAATLLACDPVELVHPDDRPRLLAHVQQILANGHPQGSQEYRVFRYDGRVAVLEVLSLVLDWEGRRSLLTFGRDVSDRKEVEARLILADRLALLGATAAGIAHEINTPLTFSSMAVDQALAALEARDVLPTDLRAALTQSLADARDGIERVATIVRELRAIARPPGPPPVSCSTR